MKQKTYSISPAKIGNQDSFLMPLFLDFLMKYIITKPEKLIPYMDEIQRSARQCGTIKKKLRGSNVPFIQRYSRKNC
jgi:hypothetical protein